jgi:IS30 family transposase
MPESDSNYHRLTFDDRCEIQRLLSSNATMSEIARRLSVSVSSVTREIRRNRRDDGYRVSPTSTMTRLCAHARTCEVKGLCRGCWSKRCASCAKMRCTNICTRYERDICAKNTAAPAGLIERTKDRTNPFESGERKGPLSRSFLH